MANEDIRPGNEKVTTITLYDGTAIFPLYDTSFAFTVVDQAGNVVINHTLSVDSVGGVIASNGLAIGPDGAASGVVVDTTTAAETAPLLGWYRWSLKLTDANGNTPVEPADEGGWNLIADTPYIVPQGITRKMLRRRILQRLGDLTIVVATADGSTTTLIDQRRLTGEPNAYRGQYALFTTGRNTGEERYITGSSRDNRSISIDYELPVATVIGDEAELAYFRGMGYRFMDVHMAIDTAIDNAADTATEPVMMSVSSAFARVPGEIQVPDDWVSVGSVQWQDESDQPWQNMTYAGRYLGSGWSVNRANRTILIGKERGYRIDEKSVRIMGYRRPSLPQNDDDLVGINAEWIIAESIAHLSMAAYRRNPNQERQQMMAVDLQQAGIMRSRVLKRTGGTVRL